MVARQLVHLVDDSAAMRATVAAILESDGMVVREHATAGSLLAESAVSDADCVLTDLRMPRVDGLELLIRLRKAGSGVPVIVMTGHGDVSLAVRAMKLGACDFIEKPFRPDTLLQAVRGAAHEAGTSPCSVRRALALERIARLTGRERQVFDRILCGRTHRETGDELGISPRTVEVFRSRIMAKTECATIQDLVRTGIEAGLG